MRVYLDTAPIIYLVENVNPFNARLIEQLSQPNMLLVVSDLSRLECLVKPLRDNNRYLFEKYEQFFRVTVAQTMLLSTGVIDLATEIRAHHRFTTSDAIHLAAAIVAECDRFLTNDHRLQRFDGIHVDVITAKS